jgi:hypothetical protein
MRDTLPRWEIMYVHVRFNDTFTFRSFIKFGEGVRMGDEIVITYLILLAWHLPQRIG